MQRLRYDEIYTEPYEDTEEEKLRVKWSAQNTTRYRLKTIKCNNVIESEIFPIWDTATQKKVDSIYAQKPEESDSTYTRNPEEERKIYERRRRKYIRQLLNKNFSNTDSWVTGTFADDKLPSNIDEARKHVLNYIRRIKYMSNKMGYPALKYIYAIEMFDIEGNPVHCHVHLICNVSDRDMLERLWKGGGRTQARRLQPDDYGLTGMAMYVIKADSCRNGKRDKKKAYGYTLNLEKPEVTKADSKITKSKAKRMANDIQYAESVFRKLYPKYRLLKINVYHNELIDGYYIAAHFHDDFADECKNKKKRME